MPNMTQSKTIEAHTANLEAARRAHRSAQSALRTAHATESKTRQELLRATRAFEESARAVLSANTETA